MPQLILTVDNATLARVVTAFEFNEPRLDGESDGQYARRIIIQGVRSKVLANEKAIRDLQDPEPVIIT